MSALKWAGASQFPRLHHRGELFDAYTIGEINFPASDQVFIEVQEWQAKEIARMFDVPPRLVIPRKNGKNELISNLHRQNAAFLDDLRKEEFSKQWIDATS